MFKKYSGAIVLIISVIVTVCGCSQGNRNLAGWDKTSQFESFYDIPGVTAAEIAHIESLKSSRDSFSFGTMISNETFVLPDGTYSGFTSLLTKRLSELFGIPFVLEIHDWDGLFKGADNLDIDFISEQAAGYYMSSLIEERALTVFIREDAAGINARNDLNGLKIGFFEGAATEQLIKDRHHDLLFETVTVNTVPQAAALLLAGKIDAVIANESANYHFRNYGAITHVHILPFAYSPFFLATANPALEPVISVLNKYLETGGIDRIHQLYTQGEKEYIRFLFEQSLTPDESAYIADLVERGAKVPVAMEGDNYPLCFYNAALGEFQGVSPDILKEITLLTGIEFENVTNKNTKMAEIMDIVKNGEAAFDAEMIYTSARADEFLWPSKPYFTSHYAFLSKADYPDLKIYQVPRARVGIVTETAAAEMYLLIVPYSRNHQEYSTRNDALDALEKDEIDLFMTTDNILLYQTHFREKAGYKINISFNTSTGGSYYGFNKNEAILCSIIDKAQNQINVDKMVMHWTNRVYDYSKKIATDRLIYMTIFAAVLSALLTILMRLFIKNNIMIKEIDQQNKRLNTVNQISSILLEPEPSKKIQSDTDHFEDTIQDAMTILTEAVGVDRICIWINLDDMHNLCFSLGYECEHGIFRSRTKNGILAPDILIDKHPVWNEAFSQGNCINSLVSDMPPAEQAELTPRNILSILVVPVLFHDRLWGFVGFDHCRIKKVFSNTEMLILRSASRMIANAIIRNDMTLQLEIAKEQAEQSNRSKSSFLSHMSHEIRTPMNAILGIAEIQLQKEKLSPDTNQAFEKIYESGDLLLNIINDILDLSKIESGRLELVPVMYDIPSLINDTVQLNHMRYESKPIEFALEIDENMPLVLIGDVLRIKQILNNILSNAFKYTEKGRIEFSISFENDPSQESGTDAENETDAEKVILVFRISDTGHGMTEEELGKLFDEYTRFNVEANRTIIGAGLGMSITKRLVSLMDGTITAESEPDNGSVFTVYLPQKRNGSDICGKALINQLKQFHFHNTTILKKVQFIREYMPYGSVLVVDDVESNIYVASGMLIPYGLHIETANSAIEAIEKIKNGNVYDIIFMDHMMPKMDGIEAVKIIRNMGYTQPIVALTANALIGRKKMFLDNGFDGYVSKPIDSRELNVTLNEFIKNRKPPEVVEAARRIPAAEKSDASRTAGQNQAMADNESRTANLEFFFIRDAVNALNILENAVFSDSEIGAYIIAVHGMKNALANINEKELSSVAFKLEEAARQRNFELLSSETPAFIDALKSIVARLQSDENDHNDTAAKDTETNLISEEDRSFLLEKLITIKTATETIDKKTIKTALKDLKAKTWPKHIDAMLDDMSISLLHSEYARIAELVDQFN